MSEPVGESSSASDQMSLQPAAAPVDGFLAQPPEDVVIPTPALEPPPDARFDAPPVNLKSCPVPQRAALINSVSVETPHGFRIFELQHGDILSINTDLLVISAPDNTGQRAGGMLAEQLMTRFGFAVEVPHTSIDFGGGVSAWMQTGTPDLLFKHLLTLRIAEPTPQANAENTADLYDRVVRAAFASIATQEFLGHTFRSIALPVLDRKRIANYEAAIRSLLHYAFLWLRQSHHTDVVRLFIYEERDLRLWSAAMDMTLGRSFVDAGNEAMLRGLCHEIIAKINGGVLAGPLAELETPLRMSISSPDKICVQTVATFGRKLAETITEQLCIANNLPIKRELLMNIEAIRVAKVTAEWITSYLHSLRVFGNEGVHSLSGKHAVLPSQLSSDDLMTILCAIRALMNYWSAHGPGNATPV
jgi:hypothetical protein